MKLIIVILLFCLNYCISMHPRPINGPKHRHGPRYRLRHVQRPIPKHILSRYMSANIPKYAEHISKRELFRRHVHLGYPRDYMDVYYYYPDHNDEGIGVDPNFYEKPYHYHPNIEDNCSSNTFENCESDEFDCGDGNCIHNTLLCDGNKNCANGRDEYNDFCVTDERTSCMYPVRMAHMTFTMNYTLDSIKRGRPPEVPQFVQAVFTCDPGYMSYEGNSVVSTCTGGSWQPGIPICLKPCADLETVDMQQTCFYHNEQIDCNKLIAEGTVVLLSCQQPHYYPNYDRILCQSNGIWSISPEDLKCHSSCGKFDREVVEVMKGKDFPWRILIKETVNECEHFFSGTLIDSKLILSDRSGFNRSVNPNDFLLYVNDDVASWAPLEMGYKVKNIHFIDDYYHELESPNGLGSLVIFETVNDIEFGVTVFQACISPYSNRTLYEITNATGRIVTVGNVNERQNLDRDDTFISKVSYIDNEACSKLINRTNWYTDQFCGLMQGTRTLTDADLGTGLVKRDKKTKLFFLEGVYSGVHPNSNVMTFTIVSDYVEWIDAILAKVKHSRHIQKKVSSQQDKPHNNLLIVFLLLSFVILIAVFLRIR